MANARFAGFRDRREKRLHKDERERESGKGKDKRHVKIPYMYV